MFQSMSRRSLKPLVTLAAVAAMLLSVNVASAGAVPQISKVTPNPVIPPTLVSVEGTEFGAFEAKNIAVGICTEALFSGVPACGVFATNVAIDGSGVLTASMNANSSTFSNLHKKLPGQPTSFDCEEEACGVLVVDHQEGKQTVIDFEPLTFE